jgi:hypothetical protein
MSTAALSMSIAASTPAADLQPAPFVNVSTAASTPAADLQPAPFVNMSTAASTPAADLQPAPFVNMPTAASTPAADLQPAPFVNMSTAASTPAADLQPAPFVNMSTAASTPAADLQPVPFVNMSAAAAYTPAYGQQIISAAGYLTPTASSTPVHSFDYCFENDQNRMDVRRKIFAGGNDSSLDHKNAEVGDSPGCDKAAAPSGSPHTNSSEDDSESLPTKKMKTASASSQFFTTIVVKVCVTCREWVGTVPAERRAAYIFKKVEAGLRDRVAFPLPPNVSIKELMANSYFQGSDADANFRTFCVNEDTPLQEKMIDIGTRLYNNKFTDIKKHITNHVLPKFISICKKQTGQGFKSGYVVEINLNLYI